MKGSFEVAAGSIVGRHHVQAGKNNQDAYYYISDESGTIAVVCDGCSSGNHSEVGAKIGARVVAEAIAFYLGQEKSAIDALFWEQVKDEVVRRLEEIGLCLSYLGYSRDETHRQEHLSAAVGDYFLFTIVGALIAEDLTAIFSVGDGVIGVNGTVKPIGVEYCNVPPYLGYAICGHPEGVRWQIEARLPTAEVENILIATDGVEDLIGAENENIPGKEEKVGEIAQFWRQDRYFHNPDAIRRRLSLINRQIIKPDWQRGNLHRQPGLLPDDTTLMVIRKR